MKRRKDKEMSQYKFEVRHTGRPFGPCEKMDASDYQYTISKHTTLSAARKRQDAERGEMHRYCGPNAWSNHFAIFPLADTPVQGTTECYVCYQPMTIKYTWQAETLDPWLDYEHVECPTCKERRHGMNHIEEYEDMVKQQEVYYARR